MTASVFLKSVTQSGKSKHTENVFEGKSSRVPSVAEEGGKVPDAAAADNNDFEDAVNTLTQPAVYRCSSNDIKMDYNQKDIFLVHKIVTNDCDDTVIYDLDDPNDENTKIEELCELSVDTSYEHGVYNSIDFWISKCYLLSPASLEAS